MILVFLNPSYAVVFILGRKRLTFTNMFYSGICPHLYDIVLFVC